MEREVFQAAYDAAKRGAAFARMASLRAASVAGKDRASFLQGLLTNDMRRLEPGKGMRHCVLTPKGRLLGDLTAYDVSDACLLVFEAAAKQGILGTIAHGMALVDCVLDDLSETLGAYYLAGPRAGRALPDGKDAAEIPGGGYLLRWEVFGPGGLLCLTPDPDGLLAESAKTDVELPAEVLDALRVEKGLPRYGVDMDHGVFPAEAGLDSCVDFKKGCFLGQETTAYIRNRGHLNRRIVRLASPKSLAAGTDLFNGGEKVGRVTSSAYSPASGAYAALGMVKAAHASAGSVLKAGGEDVAVLGGAGG